MLLEIACKGHPITVSQNQRFINHCNRRPIVVVSKTVGIEGLIAAFYNCRYRLDLSIFFLIIFFFEKSLSL